MLWAVSFRSPSYRELPAGTLGLLISEPLWPLPMVLSLHATLGKHLWSTLSSMLCWVLSREKNENYSSQFIQVVGETGFEPSWTLDSISSSTSQLSLSISTNGGC